MFVSRSSLLKPSPFDRGVRISSPSSVETLRPNSARRSTKACATVLLPEPDSPVNQIVSPWRNLGGLVSLRISATAGRLNHSGSCSPLARELSGARGPRKSAGFPPGGGRGGRGGRTHPEGRSKSLEGARLTSTC